MQYEEHCVRPWPLSEQGPLKNSNNVEEFPNLDNLSEAFKLSGVLLSLHFE